MDCFTQYLCMLCIFASLESLEKHASIYICAKLQKHAYTYNSTHFQAEINTSDSKTPTTFIPFCTDYD